MEQQEATIDEALMAGIERAAELPAEVAPAAVTEPSNLPDGAFGTEPVLDRSIEEQIKDLEAQLDKLDAQRTKSAVEELVLEPTILAAVASQRAKERFPRAQKEVEKHIKQLAWSGERVAYLEPSTPIFNNKLIQWLVGEGFSAKLIKIKETGAHKVEVTW